MTSSNNNLQTEIAISGLNPEIEKHVLMAIFEPFGKIGNIKIQRNNENKSCSAVIQYENDTDANSAISKMDGQEIKGNTIKIIKIESNNNEGKDDDNDNENSNSDVDDVDDDDEFDDDGDSDDDDDDE